MQTELIDVAMKAIAAHVAAPYKQRIAELETLVNFHGKVEDITPMHQRIEELESKLANARSIQGGMQKKNDSLVSEITQLKTSMDNLTSMTAPANAVEIELRKHLKDANALIKNLEQENRNLRGELSGKRFASKSKMHKAVVEQSAEPDARPQPPKTGVGHGGLVLNMNDAREWDHS